MRAHTMTNSSDQFAVILLHSTRRLLRFWCLPKTVSTSTRRSGKKKIVLARCVHNDRLIDALGLQAFAALKDSSGARAYYD